MNKKFFALGRLKQGAMNKTEAAYEQQLKLELMAGEILWYRFEGIKLRLADKTFLTVDFAVLRKDGLMELRDVKGYMMEDAHLKLRMASEAYPFRFVIVRKKGKSWETTVYE